MSKPEIENGAAVRSTDLVRHLQRRVVALRKALQPFASEFERRMMKSGMNSTARREWNERMPDEFPITLKVTMGDCRRAKRMLSNGESSDRPSTKEKS